MILVSASPKWAGFDSYLTSPSHSPGHILFGPSGVLSCWDPRDISDPATQSDTRSCHVLAAEDVSFRDLEVQAVVQFPAFLSPGRPALHAARTSRRGFGFRLTLHQAVWVIASRRS